MTIYDISQEVFTCKVYPNDPHPTAQLLARMTEGQPCNLSAFSMGAHNGTHIDAPYHFIQNGRTVEQVALERLVGMAYVAVHDGMITARDAQAMLARARAMGNGCEKRILVKGDAEMSLPAAKVMAEADIWLFGNESQTVGPEDAPMEIHQCLLARDIVLLEGIRLDGVPEGAYLLCAAPLCLAGFDGAPCRAVLIAHPVIA